jgi:hypothetical protein
LGPLNKKPLNRVIIERLIYMGIVILIQKAFKQVDYLRAYYLKKKLIITTSKFVHLTSYIRMAFAFAASGF